MLLYFGKKMPDTVSPKGLSTLQLTNKNELS